MSNLFLDGSKLLYHLPIVKEWVKGKEIFPIHVEISPSSACNQRCILCCVNYKGHEPNNLDERMLVELVRDFKECGVKSFLLAGEGEPLLNKGIVPMLKESLRQGIDAALNSNAILLSEEISYNILPALTWARFTIQASDPDTYAEIHQGKKDDFE